MGVDIPATVIFAVVTTLTPGPNNILCASSGALVYTALDLAGVLHW